MRSRWCVYVLRCADGTYYTGITNDLVRRLDAHHAAKASKYTRSRLPVRVVCTLGSWPTRSGALELEARIKAMTRRQKQALIRDYAGDYVGWIRSSGTSTRLTPLKLKSSSTR